MKKVAKFQNINY